MMMLSPHLFGNIWCFDYYSNQEEGQAHVYVYLCGVLLELEARVSGATVLYDSPNNENVPVIIVPIL